MKIRKGKYESRFFTIVIGFFGQYLVEKDLTTADAAQVRMRDFWAWINDKDNPPDLDDVTQDLIERFNVSETDIQKLLGAWADPFEFCQSLYIFWPLITQWHQPKPTVAPDAICMAISVIYDGTEFKLPLTEVCPTNEQIGNGRVMTNWRTMLLFVESWFRNLDLQKLPENKDLWACDLTSFPDSSQLYF